MKQLKEFLVSHGLQTYIAKRDAVKNIFKVPTMKKVPQLKLKPGLNIYHS